MNDLLGVALLVVDALDACGIRYSIGGSLASSMSGEPRASIDVDIVVDLPADQVEPLVSALGPAFYVDADALRRAVHGRSTANIIHHATGTKVDLFVTGSRLETHQLERRREVQIQAGRAAWVHSAEDILLQKLQWFRQGGEVSERQWRDALSILLVQQGRLEEPYLSQTAAEAGLSDLLERLRREARG